MKKILIALLALLACVMVFALTACVSTAKTNKNNTGIVVYKNGNIYTADANHDYVTTMAVKDGRFVYVGDEAGAGQFIAEADRVVDLNGETVISGLIEGHTHFGFMAAMHSLGYIEIPNGTVTVEDSLKELKKFVKEHPDYDQYVIGNFSQSLDLGAAQLDEICSDKPVACVGMGLHCLYVNSKFMEVGGINKDTPDAIPGETYYVRDAQGNPTGKIVELPQSWNAFQKAIKLDNAKVKAEYLKLQDLYHSYGFTGIADGGFLGLDEENMLKNITELDAEGKLSMIVSTASIWYGHTVTSLDEIKNRVTSNKKNYTTDLVRPGTVKMWADGTIGAYSALMRAPYVGKNTCGVHLNTVEDLIAWAQMCKENDINIHYHAIGDQAIDNVLTAFETVGETSGTKSIVHFQLNSPDLIKRASKIDGLIVNMTPSWGSVLVPEEVEPLGARKAYDGMFKEAMNAGITVNFGADSNGSESAWNPSMIMCIAMIRNPKEDGIFLKGLPCTFEDVVEAYSINVAKERRIDDEFGSIEVGKYADFVLWDKEDMMYYTSRGETGFFQGMKDNALHFAEVVCFKGKVVYANDEYAKYVSFAGAK